MPTKNNSHFSEAFDENHFKSSNRKIIFVLIFGLLIAILPRVVHHSQPRLVPPKQQRGFDGKVISPHPTKSPLENDNNKTPWKSPSHNPEPTPDPPSLDERDQRKGKDKIKQDIQAVTNKSAVRHLRSDVRNRSFDTLVSLLFEDASKENRNRGSLFSDSDIQEIAASSARLALRLYSVAHKSAVSHLSSDVRNRSFDTLVSLVFEDVSEENHKGRKLFKRRKFFSDSDIQEIAELAARLALHLDSVADKSAVGL